MSDGKVVFDYVGDTSGIDKSSKEAEGKLGKFAKGAGKTLAAIGTAAVGAGVAIMGIATKTAEQTDRVDKLSQKIGLSRTAFQEWDFIMSQSGSSVEVLQMGMKTLSTQFEAAQAGSKDTAKMFADLGVSMDENLSQDELFERMVIGLQGMEEGTAKTAIASKLLGRSGTELLPLLNAEAGALEEMKQQAHDLGLVLSDEAVDAGVEFTDSMDQLQRTLQATMVEAFTPLMPTLDDLIQVLVQMVPPLLGFIQPLVDKLVPVIDTIITKLLPVFISLLEAFLPVLDPVIDLFLAILDDALLPLIDEALIPIIEELLPVVIELFSGMIPPIMELVKMLLPPMVQVLKALMVPLLPLISSLLPPMLTLLDSMIPLVAALTPAIEWMAQALEGEMGKSIQRTLPIVESLFGILDNLIQFITNVFTGQWGAAWENVVSHFGRVWETMQHIFKPPINFVIDGINRFTAGLRNIQIPDWVPGVGGRGINIKQIPRLKVGIDYVPDDEYLALLHKGEAVLTAEEAAVWRAGQASHAAAAASTSTTTTSSVNNYIYNSPKALSMRDMRMADLMREQRARLGYG